MVDHAARIWRLWQGGHQEAAAKAYATLLPETNTMRSLEHLIAYGKRIFGLRTGLATHDRAPCDRPTVFGLACAERHAAALGSFRLQSC